MKIAKVRALGAAVVVSTLGFSTAAWAYVPRDYCSKLGNSFRDWVEWIFMCT